MVNIAIAIVHIRGVPRGPGLLVVLVTIRVFFLLVNINVVNVVPVVGSVRIVASVALGDMSPRGFDAVRAFVWRGKALDSAVRVRMRGAMQRRHGEVEVLGLDSEVERVPALELDILVSSIAVPEELLDEILRAFGEGRLGRSEGWKGS
jgi:hypothetical protein